jgi:hypothetical protein
MACGLRHRTLCSEAILDKEGQLYADSGCSAEATPHVRLSRLPHRKARLSYRNAVNYQEDA